MGTCCSTTGAELPEASEDDIKRLTEKGYIPIVAFPKQDVKGENELKTLYIAEYENGVELTLLFLDEDRVNCCMDLVYDTIRRPLFGRSSDIETVIVMKDDNGELVVDFPGTYSGDQVWDTRNPSHNHAQVKMSKFKQKDGQFVLWCNTWNHLMGEKNTNTNLTRSTLVQCGTDTAAISYTLRQGSRAEVDGRFKGLMTSVAEIMTEEKRQKLGKRLY